MSTEATQEQTPVIEMVDVLLASSPANQPARINWKLQAGQFWIIAGIFGSGRNDFVATAAGLQNPAAGMIQWWGQQPAALKEEELVRHRARIGVVFAGGGRLFNRMTVAENVALPLRYHQDLDAASTEEPLRHVLETLDLMPLAQRMPASLSVQWQTRVALARALILSPEILLVDRPLVGMDARHQRWWIDSLSKLARGEMFPGLDRVTVAVTTDSLPPWREAADHFALFRNNQWQENVDPAQLDEPAGEIWSEEV